MLSAWRAAARAKAILSSLFCFRTGDDRRPSSNYREADNEASRTLKPVKSHFSRLIARLHRKRGFTAPYSRDGASGPK